MLKKKNAGKKINKSAFVRSLPADMPAKEVVEKGKADGVSLSVEYVYSIRNAARVAAKKTNAGEAPRRPGRPPKAAALTLSSVGSSSRVEDLLRAVAAELGLSHAIGLLQA